MTKLDNFLQKSNLTTLNLSKKLYKKLIELEYDPISMEFQILSLFGDSKILTKEDIVKFSRNISEIFPEISFDDNTNIIKMLPKDYEKIVEELSTKQDLIKKLIEKNNSNKTDEDDFRENEIIKLAAILKIFYSKAPKGFQMTFVHLFGIKYSEQLKKLPVKRIAILATGKESLWVEISKGMKLNNYVKIENDRCLD